MKLLGAAAVLVIALAAGSAAAEPTATVPPFSMHWLKASAQGDRYEIAVGRLAQRRATTTVVRRFGTMLITDHNASLLHTRNLATQLGVAVPARPNPVQRLQLQMLSTTQGPTFTRLLGVIETADHRLDIEQAAEASVFAEDARVRALARKELPVLRKHLQMALEVQAS
jgi:putative membrane protein